MQPFDLKQEFLSIAYHDNKKSVFHIDSVTKESV